jgi:hypothetical protein
LGFIIFVLLCFSKGEFKELSDTVEQFAQLAKPPGTARSRSSISAATTAAAASSVSSSSSSRKKTAAAVSGTASRRVSVSASTNKGGLLSFELWAAAWSAHFENKLIRSPNFQQLELLNHTASAGRVRARHNWLKVVRTVTTARYWSTLVNFPWQENGTNRAEEEEEEEEEEEGARLANRYHQKSLSSPTSHIELSRKVSTRGSSQPQHHTPDSEPPQLPSPEQEARNDKHKLLKRNIKSTSPPPSVTLEEEEEEEKGGGGLVKFNSGGGGSNKIGSRTSTLSSSAPNSKKDSKTIEKMKKSIGIELDEEVEVKVQEEEDEVEDKAGSPTGKSLEQTMRVSLCDHNSISAIIPLSLSRSLIFFMLG